jgi:site-specific DNA-methyltransferase (adenine-specific)
MSKSKPYQEINEDLEVNTVIHGDCIKIMKDLPDNSIDAIVTDPPYGLGFMNKEWDSFSSKDYQDFCYEWGVEALRVLKLGGYCLAFSGARTYHRLVVGLEDAGFEIKDMINWCYGCLSEDTEILTLEGWKGMDELSINDKVFSFDYETKGKRRIKISKVLNVFRYNYNGDMIHFKNDNTDQLLTPNHKVLCKIKGRKQKDDARKYYWKNEEWRYIDAGLITIGDYINLPLGVKYDGEKRECKLFWELVGLILTDGWFQGNAINISQVKPKIVKRIKYVLGRLFIDYSEYKKEKSNDFNSDFIEHQFYIKETPLTKKIQRIIPNKKPIWDLLHISYEEKEGLYKGLMEGDGGNKETDFYQSDIKTLEWFQVLCHLMGKQARINKNKMCVSIHNNPTTEIQGKHSKKLRVKYNGLVWCIETTIGNFFARRNGRIFITGNSGFPKNYDISKGIDKHLGIEHPSGELISKNVAMSAGNYSRNNKMEVQTDLAKCWDGWGTALKPAHEPIVVAQKPRENTYVDNVLKWGVGGLNIDGCRIKTIKEKEPREKWEEPFGKKTSFKINQKGRWPANLILSHYPECGVVGVKKVGDGDIKSNVDIKRKKDQFFDMKKKYTKKSIANYGEQITTVYNCHPECPIRLLDEMSGDCPTGEIHPYIQKGNSLYGHIKKGTINYNFYPSGNGGASRFFYCAKTHKSERNAGLDDINDKEEYKSKRPSGVLYNEEEPDGWISGLRRKTKNDIATLKPINVMRWLVKLVCPKEGVVLDPFGGSGTTAIACIIEGMNYIIIEKRERFAKVIIPKRLEYWKDPKNWDVLKDHNALPKVEDLQIKKRYGDNINKIKRFKKKSLKEWL